MIRYCIVLVWIGTWYMILVRSSPEERAFRARECPGTGARNAFAEADMATTPTKTDVRTMALALSLM